MQVVSFFNGSSLKMYDAVAPSYGSDQGGYYADLILESNGQLVEHCPYLGYFMERGTKAYVGFFVKRKPLSKDEYVAFPVAAKKF